MTKLSPTDASYLLAAQGWLELGDHLEANEELEKITPVFRVHPDVLELRWQIYAKAKQWIACLDLGNALIASAPDRAASWRYCATALHHLFKTEEALKLLTTALEKFPTNKEILYALACYAMLLDRMDGRKDLPPDIAAAVRRIRPY